MAKSIKEIADIAAGWWADVVANPKFDNGDDSQSGGIAMVMAMMGKKEIEPVTIEKFREVLSRAIEAKINKNPDYKGVIGCDYGPDGTLRAAAEEAGMPDNNFPWKTTMWFDQNHVSVSYGYRGKTQFLYANKAYWEKQIYWSKKTIEDYKDGTMLSWVHDEEEKKKQIEERVAMIEEQIVEYEAMMEKAEA